MIHIVWSSSACVATAPAIPPRRTFMAPATPTISSTSEARKSPAALAPDQLVEIATNAYIYAYPLVLMEMTRRVGTNVPDLRQFGKAPMNQFASLPAFPDAKFTDVVRPNADTLYS